jgi:hypothetical protein
MSLTRKAELALNDVGLLGFYNKDPKRWLRLVKETYAFVKSQFPSSAVVRPDDVAQALLPLLGINESLREYLQERKLKQAYWITYFADLILDRNWNTISS